MNKKLFITSVVGVSMVVFTVTSLAMMDDMKNTEKVNSESVSKAVNVGNKVCPVTGEKIDDSSKATYEYKGKIYNFCCPMCIGEFKKNPEKYIKKIEEENI